MCIFVCGRGRLFLWVSVQAMSWRVTILRCVTAVSSCARWSTCAVQYSVCARAYVRACVRAHMHVCMCVCVHAGVYIQCVFVCGGVRARKCM